MVHSSGWPLGALELLSLFGKQHSCGATVCSMDHAVFATQSRRNHDCSANPMLLLNKSGSKFPFSKHVNRYAVVESLAFPMHLNSLLGLKGETLRRNGEDNQTGTSSMT